MGDYFPNNNKMPDSISLSLNHPLPAHETKHLPLLKYPFRQQLFYLSQLNDGTSNGTALWLGAQCLSAFLVGTSNHSKHSQRRHVLELGSGIGLTALTMSSMGWHVLATDLPHIISTVLSQNISRNLNHLPDDAGPIQVRELDWTTSLPPSEWRWSDLRSITSLNSSVSSPGTADSFKPPFDLIVTADTIYIPELTDSLLSTLHSLSSLSFTASGNSHSPLIYICLERRDPALVDRFFTDAKNVWRFNVEQVPRKKVSKALERGGLNWRRDDWEGIEIWKLTWNGSNTVMTSGQTFERRRI